MTKHLFYLKDYYRTFVVVKEGVMFFCVHLWKINEEVTVEVLANDILEESDQS